MVSGVGSNRRRKGSPQDDEPVSAECDGEPAGLWRSLGLETDLPDALRWLSKRRSGARRDWGWDIRKAERSKRRDLFGVRASGRSQNPHGTAAAMSCEMCGKQSRT